MLKKPIYCIIISLIFIVYDVDAQTNMPTTTTSPVAATAQISPAFALYPSINYQRILTSTKPTTDSSQVSMNSLVEDVIATTSYFDQMGRPLQTIIKQGSPAKKDFVLPVLFNEFNSKTSEYLPYVQQTDNTNDGKFKINPIVRDSAFYKAVFPDEQIIYGQTLFDGSPLQRVLKTMAPGNSWTGASRGVSYSQRANSANDSVRLWTINIVGEDDVPATTTYYSPGSLFVEEFTNEKSVRTVSYKDALNRTILTKTQTAISPSTGHSGWLCTYYIYDEMNHLRMVIPPKATESLNTLSINWNLASNIALRNNLCYYYWYDNVGRVIMKYIPGKGKTYLAYDLLNRLTMTQDSRLRASGQWTFIKYNTENRPTKSGVITIALNKDSVLSQSARSMDYPTLSGTYFVTTEAYYDDYAWIAATGAPISSALVSTGINGTNFNTSYNTSPTYAQPLTPSSRTKGMITGVKKLILGTSSYLYIVNIYDDDGRVIQSKETNYTSGLDVKTVQYTFTGKVLRTLIEHQKAGSNSQSHTMLTKYSYDHMSRVKSVIKNLDNLGDKTVLQNTYSELGRLETRTIGSSVETQNFAYNIRGWITSLNKDFVNTAGSNSNFFGETVAYDYGFTNNQFTGAIAGVKWKASGDGIARAYGFSYDAIDRLTTADFSQQNKGSSAWTNDKVDFKFDGITYDAGSNILTMRQRGMLINTSATIDSLTYQYFANSNQLQKVSDGIANSAGGLGDFKDTSLVADDYTYDVNGNITKDNNRHMHTIANGNGAAYNILDKPDSMVMAGKATLYYYYDATGAKLRKQVNDYTSGSLVIKNYLFINGFVYMNDTLQFVLQEEGRIRYAKKRNSVTGAIYTAFEYDYFIRDHQGNVRTVLTEGRDTAAYAASMETADSIVTRALFSNVYDPVNTVVSKPGAFDTDGANQKVSRLNASAGVNKKLGPALVLKVMAGDKVQINTFAYFNTATQPPVGGVNLLSEILGGFAGGITSPGVGKFGAGDLATVSAGLSPGVTQFLTNDRSYDNTRPKAYLNWILFDNQFNYVASNSGVQQVQAGASKQALVAPLQTIANNGYLYVYVSNESPQDVYFDDLTVKHYSGPLLQEQSYYPFGLQMAAISDKALNKLSTQYKYDGGVEVEEDFGINLYSTFYRQYDPQIGRFNGIDIRADESAGYSTYQYAANNPINFNDPLGDKQQQSDPIAAISSLLNSLHGGTWTRNNGESFFMDDEAAFAQGSIQITMSGGWGTNGFTGSFSEAQALYYKYGGTDARIANLIEPIILRGTFSAMKWRTRTSEAEIEMQLKARGYLVPDDSWVDSYNDATGWGSAGLAAYQMRVYGAAAGPKILSASKYWWLRVPGNQGWWVNDGGIYKAFSKGVAGTEELSAASTINKFEKVGKVGFGVTAVISTYELFENLENHNYKAAGKNGLDITMAAIGTFGGPAGAVVSTIYFIGDFFDWWGSDD